MQRAEDGAQGRVRGRCSRPTPTAKASRSAGTCSQVLKPKVPVKRIVFHEITKKAIDQAVADAHDVDDNLVRAQESRRILDRLYGYTLSPVLWKKVQTGLSAGRVQSVAVRLIVDREEERLAFRTAPLLGSRRAVLGRGARLRRDADARRRRPRRQRARTSTRTASSSARTCGCCRTADAAALVEHARAASAVDA